MNCGSACRGAAAPVAPDPVWSVSVAGAPPCPDAVEPQAARQAVPQDLAGPACARAWTEQPDLEPASLGPVDLEMPDLEMPNLEMPNLEMLKLEPRGLALFRKLAAWLRATLESESKAASLEGEPLVKLPPASVVGVL